MGLDLSITADTCDRLEAAGEPVDRKGDHQANTGEFNRRHNHGLRALHDMLAAVALGPLVLGDKEQPTSRGRRPSTTRPTSST